MKHTYINIARKEGKSNLPILGMMYEMKMHARVDEIDTDRGYFTLNNGQRCKFNPVHFRAIEMTREVKPNDLLELVEEETTTNAALYLSKSMMVKTLLAKRFDEQASALSGFIEMQVRSGKYEIELSASEWLMFARACEYMLKPELGGLAIRDGVDIHAAEILNSIDGNKIQGVIARVKKESDVPFVQWEETEKGNVWQFAVS